MPPSVVYIVRHSERYDKKHPDSIASSARPHDPSITDSGKDMAKELGKYLVQSCKHCASDIVVMSSPLVRAVQTAHGIVDGICEATDVGAVVPLYVEPLLLEGCQWIMHDINKCRALCTSKSSVPLPEPLYYDATYLHEHVSRHVCACKPYELGVALDLVVDDKQGCVTEADVEERCRRAARALLSCPALDGKVVVAVGHGLSVFLWANALLDTPLAPDVSGCDIRYTSFICLHPRGAVAAGKVVAGESSSDGADDDETSKRDAVALSLCECASPCFATPHLPYAPSEY